MLLLLVICLSRAVASASPRGCDCVYDNDLEKVSCDPGTQFTLPWYLPHCLDHIPYDKIEGLVLSDQEFPTLPASSFAMFPNLRYLDLTFSKIEKVEEFAFNENRKMRTMILNGNRIESLPNLFSDNDHALESLTANHNRLSMISSENLSGILFLSIEDNQFTEAGIAQSLSNMPNLFHLSIEKNNIELIQKTTFSNQQGMQFLSVWGNNLNYIQPGSLDHMTLLESLDLMENDDLEGYITESWHFCHSLQQESLDIKIEYNKKIAKDLKVDDQTETYCHNNPSSADVDTMCDDNNGHLTCSGDIEDIICELKIKQFKSIKFIYPKDKSNVQIEPFFEAETNAYFQEINGQSNMTQYLADLKLYGTKFDLKSLEQFTGPRTETVTVTADTVVISEPLINPVNYSLTVRARVVSITEDIAMNMTRDQFFTALEADQLVDNWAAVEEVITEVGNSSFMVRKQGLISVMREHKLEPRSSQDRVLCSPRYFSVKEYEDLHNTSPSVFFDRVQMNLLRVAVRTLASTRSNDVLAVDMADHTLSKTSDPTLVADKAAYRVAQKLIHDKDVIRYVNHNVPFYTPDTMGKLANLMYTEMLRYKNNETLLMLELNLALASTAAMNKRFDEAKMERELYFRMELATLESIWDATQSAADANFDANREMEDSIMDAMQKNGEEMMNIAEKNLQEMLARAQDTVESDRATVEKFKEEISRYSEEAQMSVELQRQKLKETNEAGDQVEREQEALEDAIDEWKEEQMRKAFFGFLKAIVGVAIGIATMQPEIAGAAVAGAAMEAGEIAAIFEGIVELLDALKDLDDVLDSLSGVGDIDVDIPDINGDFALEMSDGWRSAIEKAYEMKNMSTKFNDIRIQGETIVDSIGPNTDYGVDPAPMKQAMFTFCDRGTQLIDETVNFAGLMMNLADIAGDLQVAEIDLENAIEDVKRIEQMLADMSAQHDDYVEWMQQHRDEYEAAIDDMQANYDAATEAKKEEYKQNVTGLYEDFNQWFEQSNKQYIARMNDLTASLYGKVAAVTQHSMVQRSMIMNLNQDFCDGLFYVAFEECYSNNHVPTMSDDFDTLLKKLNEIQWDALTWMEYLPNMPEIFDNQVVYLLDQHQVDYDEANSTTYGAATSLRETGEVNFNFREYDDYLDQFYRVRIDSILVHLLDKNTPPNIFKSPDDEVIGFKVYNPLEFTDKDSFGNKYSFRGMKQVCTSDYFLENGEVHQIHPCQVSAEVDGTNHKTSHDGMFKVKVVNVKQEYLDQIGGIKVTLGGTSVTSFQKKNGTLIV